MAELRAPARRPCNTCPYRRDVPSGVWAEEEYLKLPEYDLPTGGQPPSVFMCHQQDGRLCAGWVAVHDMDESLALRLAAITMSEQEVEAVLDYTTDVPLFESGQEAHDHGMREHADPNRQARDAIRKLERRGRGRREADSLG